MPRFASTCLIWSSNEGVNRRIMSGATPVIITNRSNNWLEDHARCSRHNDVKLPTIRSLQRFTED